MNSRTFFEKVALMREAQKDYFRTRSHDALRKSKALEAEIDHEIGRVRVMGHIAPVQPQQPNLFAMQHISDILDRHDQMIRQEIDEEIANIAKQIEEL